jgi:hypothetical protein
VTGARRRGWSRSSQRVGGVDVAGLEWVAARRRCSRQRLLRSGSPAVSSGAFPRPAPRVPVQPQQRRAGGGAAHRPSPPLLLFFYLPPFLFPFGGAALERGKNPNVGWWRWTTAPCLPPLAFETPAPQGKAKSPCCPGLVCPGARGGAACFLSTRSRSQGHGAGVNGTFPPPARLDLRVGAPGPSACVSAGRPGHAPHRACWCGGTGGAWSGSVTRRVVAGEGEKR